MERSAYGLLRARVSIIPCPASHPNGDSSDTTDLSHMQTASRQTPPICPTCKRRVVRHHRFVSYGNGESSDTTDLSHNYANGESSDTTDLSHMQTASRQTPPICLLCFTRSLSKRFGCCQAPTGNSTTVMLFVFSEGSKTTFDSLLSHMLRAWL